MKRKRAQLQSIQFPWFWLKQMSNLALRQEGTGNKANRQVSLETSGILVMFVQGHLRIRLNKQDNCFTHFHSFHDLLSFYVSQLIVLANGCSCLTNSTSRHNPLLYKISRDSEEHYSAFQQYLAKNKVTKLNYILTIFFSESSNFCDTIPRRRDVEG